MTKRKYNIAKGKDCMSGFQKSIINFTVLVFLITILCPVGATAQIKNRDIDKQEEELISQIESYYNQGKKSLAEGNFLAAIVKFNHVIKLEKDLYIVYTPYAEQYIRQAKEKIEEKEEQRDIDLIASKTQENTGILEYTIGEGDELYISVWQEENLKAEAIVRPDGKISFPLAGDIPAAGLTFSQLNEEVTQRIKKYIKYPEVSVTLRRLGGKKVIVLGEVVSPGVRSVTGKRTVLEAIALAGGFTPHAVPSSVILIRGGFQNPKGKRINLSRAIDKSDMTQNVTLEPEDIVYVPKKFIANVNYALTQIIGPLSHGAAAVRDIRYLEED